MKNILIIILLSCSLFAKLEITDDTGKKIVLNKIAKKIYTSAPPLTYSLYAIDSKIIAGKNLKVPDDPLINKYYKKLPLIGGWFGQGNTPNIEVLLSTNPDIIINFKRMKKFTNEHTMKILNNANIPTMYLKSTTIKDIIHEFKILGKLSGKEERANTLINYTKKVLLDSKKVKKAIKNPVKIFYAEDLNGLSTDCRNSFHTQVIKAANGINVDNCKQSKMFGMHKISFEKVLKYDPDVILVFNKKFYKKIFLEKKWSSLRAIKNKKVYLIPKRPFSWFDRPPSFMRILGTQWLMNKLYPNIYNIDIIKTTQDFFKLFLNVEISKAEAEKILYLN